MGSKQRIEAVSTDAPGQGRRFGAIERPELRIGIGAPQLFEGETAPLASIRRFVRRVEELPFDSIWTGEAVMGQGASLEPMSLLAYAAALTDRVRLGCAVIVLPLRAPVTLARAAAAVDQLSGGRLDLGIGMGDDPSLVGSVGLDPALRVDRFEEGLAVMRALWSGEPSTLDGRTLSIDGWTMSPRPVQRPGPPVWFGGNHRAALRRAVALGDGWIGAGGRSVAEFGRDLAAIGEELARAGRDPGSFAIGKRMYVAVSDRPSEMREKLRRWFGHHGGDDAFADRVVVNGDADTVAAVVREVTGLGADLVILNPLVDLDEQLERLAADVVPRLRADADAPDPGSPAG